jgi:hypothetical protein
VFTAALLLKFQNLTPCFFSTPRTNKRASFIRPQTQRNHKTQILKTLFMPLTNNIGKRLRWFSCYNAGLWYPSSRVQTRPNPSDFSGEKIPQHAFLRREIKTVCPMSHICGMLKNPAITWKNNPAITWKSDCLAKFDRPFSRPYFILSLIEVAHAVWRGASLEINGGTKTGLTYKRSQRLKCDRSGSRRLHE